MFRFLRIPICIGTKLNLGTADDLIYDALHSQKVLRLWFASQTLARITIGGIFRHEDLVFSRGAGKDRD